jgi:hypothetical protein
MAGSGILNTADKVRLLSIDGMIVLAMPDPTFPSGGNANANSLQNPHDSTQTIYVPLPLDDESGPPSSWTEGQICYQTSSSIAWGRDGVVTQEVTSANCIEGWDTSCAPDCSSAVGGTYTTIDPVTLIGG